MSHIIFSYGTLRPGGSDTVEVKGSLYDLGWFPGIVLDGQGAIVCERIEVQDLSAVDRYEGYREDDVQGSLYIRRPHLDGWIYEYNRGVSPSDKIEGGDWLVYKEEKRGSYGGRF